MKKARILKRAGAVMLTLAMLVGMMSVMGAASFGASAEEVTKFIANFQAGLDRSDLVWQNNQSANDQVLLSDPTVEGATDAVKASHDWLSARFNSYMNFHNNGQRSYFGQKCENGCYFTYGQRANRVSGRALVFQNAEPGGEAFWSINTLVPKHNGEEIVVENFEATVKFVMANSLSGGLLFAFHEEPTKYTFASSYTIRQNTGSVLAIGNNVDSKATYGQSGTSTDSWKFYADGKVEANYMTNVDKTFDANLDDQWYTLTVKAVNGTAIFTITNAAGTAIATMDKAYTSTSGKISVGLTGREVLVNEITVTELDENGNAVDLGYTKEEDEYAGVNKFNGDFAELNNSGSFSGNAAKQTIVYNDPATDTSATNVANHNWLSTRFDSYTNFHNVVQRSYFSQGDEDGGSPFVYGALNALGGMADAYRGLLFDNRSPGGELFWSINTLVPKYDGEAITVKNFEATVKFAMTNDLSGGLLFAFHESAAGQYAFADSYATRKNTGSVLAIGNNVDTKAGYGAAGSSTDSWKFYADGKVEANYMTNVDKNFGANLRGQWYTLTVKAVNGTATFTLVSADGTVDETMTKTYTTESGALSLGVSGREVMLRQVTVTELDKDGIPVDLGYTKKEDAYADVDKFNGDFAELNNSGSFSGNASKQTIVYNDPATDTSATNVANHNWLSTRFDSYTNFHNVIQRSYFSQGDEDGGSPFVYGALNSFGGMADAYRGLLFDNRSPGGELFWSINTLVPKYDGKAITVKNFEATVKFAMTNSLSGGLLFAFHESAAGQYTFADSYTTRKNTGSVLAIGNNVDTTAGYGASGSSTDSWKFYADGKVEANYMTNVDKTFDANLSGQWYTLTVKAVNGTATFTLVSADGTVNETMTKTYSSTSGNVSLGFSGREIMVREIKLMELDAEGMPIDIGAHIANSAIVDGRIITVNPDDGYELKAGSLIVTDANGNRFVPTRVGYHEGGNASKYEVPAEAVAPYTVDYVFYQPTFDVPNIGTVGTSFNKEKHGLRFITRFTRQVIDGVEYVIMSDGSQYPISDYGMLVAAESGLATTPETDEEDMVVGSANAYVKQMSAVEQNKYYDICDDYIDMSACIINMDKVVNLEAIKNMKMYVRPYVAVEVEGTPHILYGDVFDSTYYNALGSITTSATMTELREAGAVRINGRHTITADGDVKVSLGNAGITLTGELEGDMYLDAKFTKYAFGQCRINVMVDGEYVEDVVAVYGDNHLKVVEGLEPGYHTVTIAKGVGTPSLGDLVFKSVTYNGSLETAPAVNDLQFMFLGDSITDTAGILGAYDSSAPDPAGVQLPSQNIRLGYAALTAKAFGADFTQVSFAGLTTSQVQCLFNEEAFPQGSTMIPYEYGSGDTTEKDVVVINLGTNNPASTVNSEAKACLDAVRAKYPNAYIVWTYGMMFTTNDQALSDAVAEWVAQTGDTKTSYCSLSAAANTDGGAQHPLAEYHAQAAEILAQHIADVLGMDVE